MSNSSALRTKPEARNKPTPEPTGASIGDIFRQAPAGGTDPHVPILLKLSAIQAKMESLQRFLSNSVDNNVLISKDQMEMVSSEIASAVEQIILNGAALLASCHYPSFPTQPEEIAQEPPDTAKLLNEKTTKGAADLNLSEKSIDGDTNKDEGDLKLEGIKEETESDELEIIELTPEQLLGERKHYCDLCGRGFKRYANLQMHIRSHDGNQFKTSEAEIRSLELWQKTRFSCPFLGCDRHKSHDKFRPLKSVVCVKNHFRRSHCPKLYSCTRCNNKNFSVLADLKSHLKHCGESSKFRCSCGTSFSRRAKLLGHMASFKGHMPAAMEEDYKARGVSSMVEDGENEDDQMGNCSDDGFFMGLFEQFASIENYCLQGELGCEACAPPDC